MQSASKGSVAKIRIACRLLARISCKGLVEHESASRDQLQRLIIAYTDS